MAVELTLLFRHCPDQHGRDKTLAPRWCMRDPACPPSRLGTRPIFEPFPSIVRLVIIGLLLVSLQVLGLQPNLVSH
jgi:hypothetical protein